MNKKILLSVSAVVAIVAVAAVATTAFFSDTQTATGNTFSAGTIEMRVDWSKTIPIELNDMKPSQVGYTNFTVLNTGSDPINVTKEIRVTGRDTVSTNRPECIAENGVWSGKECGNGTSTTWTPKNDIDSVLQYDLSVKVYNTSTVLAWNQTLRDMDKTVADLQGQKMFLGMIPSGWRMDVVESYHMKKEAGNEYQSDKITFDIVLTGEQLTGTLVLSNKDPNRPATDGWFVLGTKTATLTYGVKDSKFNYSATGIVPLASTGYSLIMYKEPFSTPSATAVWPRPVIILGSATSDGSGNITLAGSLDTGDMLNAKIWLVKTSDLVSSTLSGWDPTNYLFETGMIDYYKS